MSAVVHGSNSTYTNLACRCAPCRAAHADFVRLDRRRYRAAAAWVKAHHPEEWASIVAATLDDPDAVNRLDDRPKAGEVSHGS